MSNNLVNKLIAMRMIIINPLYADYFVDLKYWELLAEDGVIAKEISGILELIRFCREELANKIAEEILEIAS